ncbi:MAG: hypothetical protein NZM38_01760 [Cytophagales bacterium]|nr:hypothetical protein [Cytophagales bacterium]MDW8383478.1 hypothetical protein [Flammeovirgaceae bacterium]
MGRFLQAFYQRSTHDAQLILKWVKEHIPSNSKVVGEPKFYYAVRQSGSQMMYANLFGEPFQREEYHRIIWDYDYLLLSYSNRNGDVYNLYAQKSILRVVDSLVLVPSKDVVIFSEHEKEGYSAVLWKRIR